MDVIFQVESFDSFRLLTEDILENFHLSKQVTGIDIDIKTIDTAKDYLRKLFIKCNFDVDTVAEQILNTNWEKERIQFFTAAIKERRTDLYQSIITHHNTSYADTMIDFDWLLKLVIGSSELKSLKYPLLQLSLKSVNTKGGERQRMYEMNKDTLCKLINILNFYQENNITMN